MIIFIAITALETLILACMIHIVYRTVTGWWNYRRMEVLEFAVMAAASFPGIAGCARGWAGFGIPMPLIPGMPLDWVIGTNECGWVPVLVFDEILVLDITWMIVLGLLASKFTEKKIKKQYETYTAGLVESNKPGSTGLGDELIDAVVENDISSVKHYLALGADPLLIDETGYSAMDYARGRGYTDLLDLLEQHTDISFKPDGVNNMPSASLKH